MRKGSHHSEKSKQKCRESHIGWQEGKNNPFYGKKHSIESIQKMIKAKTGKNNARFGVHLSDETKRKIGDAQIGEKNHMFGKHHTDEWKKNHSKRVSGKNNPMYGIGFGRNEKSPSWKGDKVGYYGLHIWVRKNKPKVECCELCGVKNDNLELANITGKYTRIFDDYRWFCIKCHRQYDSKIITLKKISHNISNYLESFGLPF